MGHTRDLTTQPRTSTGGLQKVRLAARFDSDTHRHTRTVQEGNKGSAFSRDSTLTLTDTRTGKHQRSSVPPRHGNQRRNPLPFEDCATDARNLSAAPVLASLGCLSANASEVSNAGERAKRCLFFVYACWCAMAAASEKVYKDVHRCGASLRYPTGSGIRMRGTLCSECGAAQRYGGNQTTGP